MLYMEYFMRNNSDSDSQYRGSRLLNGILAVGIFITIAGIFLLITFPAGMTLQPAVLRALITLVAGGLIIYYTFAVSRKSWMLCTGLFLFLTGILLLLIDAHIISYSIGNLWPVVVMFGGVCILLSGVYRAHRFRPGFTVPALAIILLGILFLLFSLDIITAPLSQVVALWWPVILIIAGLGLVIMFFMWNKRTLAARDAAEDDADDFSDIDDGDDR